MDDVVRQTPPFWQELTQAVGLNVNPHHRRDTMQNAIMEHGYI